MTVIYTTPLTDESRPLIVEVYRGFAHAWNLRFDLSDLGNQNLREVVADYDLKGMVKAFKEGFADPYTWRQFAISINAVLCEEGAWSIFDDALLNNLKNLYTPKGDR